MPSCFPFLAPAYVSATDLSPDNNGVALQALETGTTGSNASSRLLFLSTTLTRLVTDYVSQALFNADRLAFGMHLAHGLVPHLFQATEWDLFLGNAIGKGKLSPVYCCTACGKQ